jgi:hypothetical protein
MRIFRAAALIALLAGPVYGQGAVPRYGEEDKTKSPQEIANEKASEQAYKNSLQNIPEQTSTDPWGIVRSPNAPKDGHKAAAKGGVKAAPAKSQTKTGGVAN